jgi:hypothetical protein
VHPDGFVVQLSFREALIALPLTLDTTVLFPLRRLIILLFNRRPHF